MAIERAFLPALRFVGGKLVQAVKGAGKAAPKAPKTTTTAASTTVGRVPAATPPIVMPSVAPRAITTPVTTRPITGADVTKILGTRTSPYIDDVVENVDEIALARASQLADDAARAAAPKVAPAAPTVAQAAEDVATTAARSRFRPTPRGTLETVGSLAPFAVAGAESAGVDVPTPLEYAALLGGVAGGGSLLARGLGRGGFLSSAQRAAFGQKGPLGKLGALTTRGVFPALGAAQAIQFGGDILGKMRTGAQPAVAEITEFPEVSTIGTEVLPAEVMPEVGALSPEEQFAAELQSAVDMLLASAEQQATEELAAIDDQYQTEIAAIRNDYDSRKQQVSNNYAVALDQIAGYQDQADQLLANAAAAAQAGYEQAAGGVQAFQAPTGMTAEEMALSGISPTAVGGAALSGAALARGLAGAEQAAAAAQRFATGVDLGGQLAATRGSQADALAALERGLMESETLSRLSKAERQDAARRAKAAAKDEAVRLEANTKLALAEKVANMTPAERAAWRGSAASKKQFAAPSWFGINVVAPSSTPLKGLTLTEVPATVGSLNDALDQVSAALTDPAFTDPSTALAAWTLFFEEVSPDFRKLLEYKKVPSSAGAMYAALFKTAPGK